MEASDNQISTFDGHGPGWTCGGMYEKASPERLACLVDYTGKFSNFFEDLLRLDRFAQSVEDELKRIVPAEEGESKRSMNSIGKQPI